MKKLTFGKGGVHPPTLKTAPADKIITVPLPMTAVIMLKQHAGAEAVPIVKVGDAVARGQKIAESGGRVSAPVHASISGTVKAIGPAMLTNGRYATAITIYATQAEHDADEAERAKPKTPRDYSDIAPETIVARIANFGVVGLGGAAFPTAMKLSPTEKAEVLVINACECEPRLTIDEAMMRAYPAQIVGGIRLMMRALGVDRAIIGIEDNKPEAIEALEQAIGPATDVEVKVLKARYPQGSEKQLLYALLGREVPSGALPIKVGAVVNNVSTAYAVYCAIAYHEPLTERGLTIDGCGNYMAAIGTLVCDLPAEAAKVAAKADVVNGGPMMGTSVVTLASPVVKNMSGITVMEPLPFEPEACTRCGECVRACPMGLEPYLLAAYGRKSMTQEARRRGAMDCIECGSCSYSCPSARPILDFIRLAKQKLRKGL